MVAGASLLYRQINDSRVDPSCMRHVATATVAVERSRQRSAVLSCLAIGRFVAVLVMAKMLYCSDTLVCAVGRGYRPGHLEGHGK